MDATAALARVMELFCQLKYDRVVPYKEGTLLLVRIPASLYDKPPAEKKQMAVAILLTPEMTEEHILHRVESAIKTLEVGIEKDFPTEKEDRARLIKEKSM